MSLSECMDVSAEIRSELTGERGAFAGKIREIYADPRVRNGPQRKTDTTVPSCASVLLN